MYPINNSTVAMKRVNTYLLIMLSFFCSRTIFAGTPVLADADRLFDFAQTAEPTLFFPSAQTQQVNEAGSDWFYRYFTGSDSYAAININGTGTFLGGSVYLLGGDFGDEPLYVGTLENLLATIDGIEPFSSEEENTITNQGNGNCVARKFPAQNDTAGFRTTTFIGDTSTVTDRTEFYEEVTSAITITVIEHITWVGDSQTVTSDRYTSYFESLGGMLFNSENDSVITTSGTNLSPSTQNINTTYAPSLFVGPSDTLCEGQEWFASPVMETTTNNPDLSGNGPAASQSLPMLVTINSIGDIVTVPGGTYSTIKMTVLSPNSKKIIWTDLNFGVRVISESYQGDSENPSSIEELIQFDLPF